MEAAGASPPGVASRLAAALSATAEATSTEALSRAHDAAMQELDKYDNTVRGLFSNVSGGQAGQPSLRMLVYNAATAPTASDLDRASAAAMTALASVDSVRVTGASFAYSEKEAADVNGWSHATVATLVTPHLVNCRNTRSGEEYDAFTVTCTTALGKQISTNGIAEEIADIRLLCRDYVGSGKNATHPHEMCISSGPASVLGKSGHPTPRFGIEGGDVVVSLDGDDERKCRRRSLVKEYTTKVQGVTCAVLPGNHILGYG
jgi:hypothetical protein